MSYFHLNKVHPPVVALLGGRTGSLALTDRTSYSLQGEFTFMLLSLSQVTKRFSEVIRFSRNHKVMGALNKQIRDKTAVSAHEHMHIRNLLEHINSDNYEHFVAYFKLQSNLSISVFAQFWAATITFTSIKLPIIFSIIQLIIWSKK